MLRAWYGCRKGQLARLAVICVSIAVEGCGGAERLLVGESYFGYPLGFQLFPGPAQTN